MCALPCLIRVYQVKANGIEGKVIKELAEFQPDKALQILDQVRPKFMYQAVCHGPDVHAISCWRACRYGMEM